MVIVAKPLTVMLVKMAYISDVEFNAIFKKFSD